MDDVDEPGLPSLSQVRREFAHRRPPAPEAEPTRPPTLMPQDPCPPSPTQDPDEADEGQDLTPPARRAARGVRVLVGLAAIAAASFTVLHTHPRAAVPPPSAPAGPVAASSAPPGPAATEALEDEAVIGAAREYATTVLATRWSDPGPNAAIERARPSMTSEFASRLLANTSRAGWAGVVASKTTSTVMVLGAVIPAEAPNTASTKYVQIRVRQSFTHPGQPTIAYEHSLSLVLVKNGDRWLVADQQL